MSRFRTSLVVACSAIAAMTFAGPAQAAPKTTVVYSSSTWLFPDFAVSHGNLAFAACAAVVVVQADGTNGALTSPGCSAFSEPQSGVAYSADGRSIAHTRTRHFMSPPPDVPNSWFEVIDGGTPTYVDPYERAHNPDGASTYGTTSTSPCVVGALGADASYTGRIDTGLWASAAGGKSWYVADRDADTIYRVDRSGGLGVVAVLPPVKVEVSAALASSLGWPSCVVGETVAFEAAPTELEVGSDGMLYVAGLPMLQSNRSADRSVIYKINPRTGKIKRLSQRYAGPVDLAVGSHGRLFVARPAADRVSVIKKGRSSTYVKLADVVSVETDERGRLYAERGPRAGADPHDLDVVRIG